MDAERTPVIVGVGQVNDRPEIATDGLDPVALMAQALRAAERDAGAPGLLADCDSLAVVSQLAWPQLNPVDGKLAEELGIAPARSEQTAKPNGDSPIRLLNEAANRIGAGEARICAVVGAEALRTAAAMRAAAAQATATQAPSAQAAADRAATPNGAGATPASPPAAKAAGHGDKPDALRDAPHRNRTSYAARHGLVVPVDVYPLYENAGRAARGESLAEGQAESGALWAGMSAVAAATPSAWLRKTVPAAEVVTPTDRNRSIAFPYTKLQVANASVNQGAGFIVTSLAEARRRGIAESRLVFVGQGAAAHEDEDVLARDSYAASPSLAVSIESCLDKNGVTAADLDHVELYSCFPCVPKLARRVLGWPVERPITVFGGLTFGGGPIGNYMSHAVACMVERLRGDRNAETSAGTGAGASAADSTGNAAPGGQAHGLLFANGGYATHNHTILLSARPNGATFPHDFDCQAAADARRGPVPALEEDHTGPATLETWTVHFDRAGQPRLGTVVARTPAGGRTLAIVPAADSGTIARLLGRADGPPGEPGGELVGELVGSGGTITATADGRIWSFAG